MENLNSRSAAQLTDLELVARLYDSAEQLREHGYRSALADWCEEAAARLHKQQFAVETPQKQYA